MPDVLAKWLDSLSKADAMAIILWITSTFSVDAQIVSRLENRINHK